jgi:hypothetical protein
MEARLQSDSHTWIEVLPQCPFRQPHWRWEYARYRVQRGYGAPPNAEGHWLRLAYEIHNALLETESADLPDELRDRRPDVFYAHQLWRDSNRLRRDAIEAFILAGEPSIRIATRFGIPATVIDAFEALFYDVRDRLRYRAYVNGVLLTPQSNGHLSEPTFGDVLKIFAYNRGALVADAILGVYASQVGSIVVLPQGISLPAAEMVALELKVKAAVAAIMLPVNERTAPELLKLCPRAIEIERDLKENGTADAEQQARAGFDAFFRQLQQIYHNVEGNPPWLSNALSNAD